MKYKVIRTFRDKETMKLYIQNKSEYETKDKNRAEELIAKGFIQEVKKSGSKKS